MWPSQNAYPGLFLSGASYAKLECRVSGRGVLEREWIRSVYKGNEVAETAVDQSRVFGPVGEGWCGKIFPRRSGDGYPMELVKL